MSDLTHRRKKLGLRAALALTLGAALSAAAHAERWVPLGPSGGTVRLLAQGTSDPARLYAATERIGLFASRDGGRSWRSARDGFHGGDIQRLAVGPGDPDAVLVATANDTPFYQIWRSRDGGASWTPSIAPPSLEGESLRALDVTFDPADARTAYAATEHGIYRTENGGETWEAWALSSAYTFLIARAPGARGSFFAAGFDPLDFHAAIYRSDDGGATWRETPPAPFGLPERWFFHAGSLFAQEEGALYRSTDGAETWTLAARLPTLEARDFAIAPSGTIYAATWSGVYSSNDGTSWSPPEVLALGQGVPRDFLSHLALVPGGPLGGSETVIAGGSHGLWRSTDRGATWKGASRGIAVHDVYSLIVMPNPQGTVLATLDGRVFRIDRDGKSWQILPDHPGLEFPLLAADPHHPGRIYGLGGSGDFGVSEDRGNSWRTLSHLSNSFAFLLKVDPVHPDVIYAGITTGGGSSSETFGYRSVDGGAHWQEIVYDALYDVAFDPARPNVGYRLTSAGVDRTADGGKSWSRLPDLPAQLLGSSATSLLFETRSRTLYVGTEDRGVFRSTDAGRTFRRINSGLPRLARGLNPTVGSLVEDAGGDIYAALPYVGVFRLNPGEGWKPINTGLPLETFVDTLVADPDVPGLLYSGSIGSSVHRLENP